MVPIRSKDLTVLRILVNQHEKMLGINKKSLILRMIKVGGCILLSGKENG
jgi:hypothetical protein